MLSPLAVPRALPSPTFYYLLGLWKKTLFSWDPPSFFTLPPCLSLMQSCHLGGHGGTEGDSPTLNSQRQWADEALSPFPAPHL